MSRDTATERSATQMETLERLLAGDVDNLVSYSMTELEKIVQLFSDQVQSHREELNWRKAELVTLETKTTERSSNREFYISLLAQTVDLQEALEEGGKTRQELQEVMDEMERLTETSHTDCSVSETRLKEMEDDLAAHCKKEKELFEETDHLKKLLEESQAALQETTSEYQRVEEELRALQNNLPAQKCPGHREADRLLDSCLKEMGLVNVLLDNKRRKQ